MTATEVRVRHWDPVIKLTHWSMVAAVLTNAVITEEGSLAHVWVGYTLAAIVVLRLIWGVVGPHEARFTSFPPSPTRALEHLREIRSGPASEHVSHNPLGALMVYAIWTTLGIILATGIAMAGVPATASFNGQAPKPIIERSLREEGGAEMDAAEGREEQEGALGEVHQAAVNLLYALIVLHIAGVAFETRRSGRNLVKEMLPGQR